MIDMKVRSPISENRTSEKLYNYIHQKIEGMEDYKWKRKTYAYKKLNVENSPYVIRAEIRWDVDWRKTTSDIINLTFSIELAVQNMLVPIWNITFENIDGVNGVDKAFEKINEEIDDFKEELEF